jgi:hypothetical protein
MVLLMGVDWTGVIEVGVPAWIAATGAAIAAVLGALNRRNTQTTNGQSLAQSVEATHAIATENAASLTTLTEEA